jgi:signal transduction histidine kinase
MNQLQPLTTLPSFAILQRDTPLFDAFFHADLLPLAITDSDGVISDANNAFFELLNSHAQVVLFQNVQSFFQCDALKTGFEAIKLHTLSTYSATLPIPSGNGATNWVTVKMTGVWQEAFKGTIIVLQDITETYHAQQVLLEKNRELDAKNKQLHKYIDSNLQLENFAYIASHDLREPLRTIGNFVQLLDRRYSDKIDGSGKEYMKFIVDGVQNMNMLIDDLLTYSRVNTEAHHIEELDMQKLLFLVIHTLSTNIKEQKAVINIGDIPMKIVASKTKLKQLFQNLIANSIKFRKKDIPPVVTISGSEDENFWHFAISDNGIGIKPEFFDKIFLLFKKLHSRYDYQGTGMGLAICKRIVEHHGGEITVESVFGEGTTFHFSIGKED